MNKQRGILGLSLAQGIVYAVAAIAVVTFLTGVYFAIYNKGKAAGEKKLTDYIAAQAQETAKTQAVIEKVVTKIETVYVDRIVKVREKGQTIVKEVPVYVDKTDDAACELRNGFVRIHDAAATNNPPIAASDADRNPSGIALSQAMSIIADNYQTCHVLREQVIGWQEFYAGLRGAINEK